MAVQACEQVTKLGLAQVLAARGRVEAHAPLERHGGQRGAARQAQLLLAVQAGGGGVAATRGADALWLVPAGESEGGGLCAVNVYHLRLVSAASWVEGSRLAQCIRSRLFGSGGGAFLT